MDLRVYVLNVGKGLCVVIPFPSGRLSVFDVDDSKIPDEKLALQEKLGYKKIALTDPVDWITSNFADESIFRFILSHPDMDHMSGLNRLAGKKAINNFWSVPNNKKLSEDDFSGGPYLIEDWKAYKDFEAAKKGNTALSPLRDASADCCWEKDGVRILSPNAAIVKEANEKEDYNHLSYVLSITHSNGRRIVLGGDASSGSLNDLAEHYERNNDGKPFDRLTASVLIAPHHGSKNNTSKRFMDAVNPSATIVPVEWGEPYDREFYKGYGDVFATKTCGNVCVEMKDHQKREVWLWTQDDNAWKLVRTD